MTGAASLIDRITQTVDYLRVSVAPNDGEWIRCEPLVDDPEHLGELVSTTKEGRGTDRDDVAMSLFVQGYAFRIASLAIGAWVMGDAVIDIAPAKVSIALGRHRPNAVALDSAVLVEVDGFAPCVARHVDRWPPGAAGGVRAPRVPGRRTIALGQRRRGVCVVVRRVLHRARPRVESRSATRLTPFSSLPAPRSGARAGWCTSAINGHGSARAVACGT